MAGKQAVYEVFTRFRIDAKGWDKSLNRLSRSLTRTGKQMQRAGQNLTQNLTLPLALAGGAAVKFAVDLEGSFAKIQNLVGVSTETLQGFTQEVRRISDATGQAQKSLADALFVVTSAGAEGAEAIQILEQAAKASASGLGVTADIARTVTAALTAYGKENLTAAQATDVLFATVREGNLEAESLAGALGPVLGLASKLGVTFAEVGANIATFTRLGVSAEQAATSLQAIFSTFLKPTDGAKKALAEFGLTAGQVRDSISKNGLADTLIDLVGRVGENDEALAEIIPNIRALRGVLGTAGVQAESYSDILLSVANSTGLVDQGFKNVSQTAGQKFKVALTQLQNVAIELGNVLIPVVIRVTEVITGLIQKFQGLSDSTKGTIVQVALVAAAIGPVLIVAGKLVVVVGTIIKVFRTATIVMSLTVGQVLAVVAAVGALIAIGIALYKNWDNIQEYFRNIWARMKLTFLQGINEVRKLWAKFLEFIGFDNSNVNESIAEADESINKLGKQVATSLPPTVAWMKVVNTTFDELGNLATSAGNAVSGFFDTFKTGGTATPIVQPQGGGAPRTDALAGLPEIGRTGGIEAATISLDQFNEGIAKTNAGLRDLNNGFNQQIEKGQAFADIVTNVLTSAFDGLGNAIISGFESGENALKQFGQFFVDFAKGLLAKMVSLIATALILSAVLSTIGFGIGTGGGAVKGVGFAKSIGNLLKGGIPSLAVGTDFVNKDGLAMLHRGEQVVPANVSGGGFSNGSGSLVARVSGGDLLFVLEEEQRKRGNTT